MSQRRKAKQADPGTVVFIPMLRYWESNVILGVNSTLELAMQRLDDKPASDMPPVVLELKLDNLKHFDYWNPKKSGAKIHDYKRERT